MPSSIITHTLGLPRIGHQRELKKATESYWSGKIPLRDLIQTGVLLRRHMWESQVQAGIQLPSSNDFSFYDRMLDMTCMLGAIPSRFAHFNGHFIDLQFGLARGISLQGNNIAACEMTKWFNTNYHYIVPELSQHTDFKLLENKALAEFLEAKAMGIITKPILIGPLTYLQLSKNSGETGPDFKPIHLLEKILPIYAKIIQDLSEAGAPWVQLDEPILCTDISPSLRESFLAAYEYLSRHKGHCQLLVANYFGSLGSQLDLLSKLPVEGIHIDASEAPDEALAIATALRSQKKILSLGLVNGRNIWRIDFAASIEFMKPILAILPTDHLWIAPSCSLQHVPWSLEDETALDPEIKNWLSFAQEKLYEVGFIAQWCEGIHGERELQENTQAITSRKTSSRIHCPEVQGRVKDLVGQNTSRSAPFAKRRSLQNEKLQLPLLPTTTIGSFPQTQELRSQRFARKQNKLSLSEYNEFIKKEITHCIQFQESIGLDVLVHGEFERNDMVEYFGENLHGFAFTQNGWVQSYGTRCVKPPILYGDVFRKEPITLPWTVFAQSLTPKPVKGMLTGPLTILKWSFVRDDQPWSETANQVALALQDEVQDLENAGISIIQIDEPGLREAMPLKNSAVDSYLSWAVNAFKITTMKAKPETQIHTHMCYAEFHDILPAIQQMDADVISLEASRSGMEILHAFHHFKYSNGVGPGVYDIHSPLVPTIESIQQNLELAMRILPVENLWVNPDCGLKTRNWAEVEPSLKNLVEGTAIIRNTLK